MHFGRSMNDSFDDAGYFVTDRLLDEDEMLCITDSINGATDVGDRNILKYRWCVDLANTLQDRLSALFPRLSNLRPVQCTLFQKSQQSNWLVSWHQDRSLPVADENVEGQSVRIKDGLAFYQPSVEKLRSTYAVRLSVDDSNEDNGGLKVLPSTHARGIIDERELVELGLNYSEVCPRVSRGSAMIMSPLLVHSSSKATSSEPRRVLHFVFS